MSMVYVETTNFNSFGFEFKKFRGHNEIAEFLKTLLKNLEEDDSFSIYSDFIGDNKRFKLTLTSRFNSANNEWYNAYLFELVDHSEGEKILEVIYEGDMINRIKHLTWDNRAIINKGLDGMC